MGTTINHNLKPWIIASVCVLAILLFAVVFRSCEPKADTKATDKAVETVKKETVVQEAVTAKTIAAATDSLKVLKKKVDSLQKKLIAADINMAVLNKRTAETIHLIEKKIAEDTTGLSAAVADLKQQNSDQQIQIDSYRQSHTGIVAAYENQLLQKDSIINAQVQLLQQLRKGNTVTQEAYNTVRADLIATTRKLKRERTLGRVLAVGVLVLGGVAALK